MNIFWIFLVIAVGMWILGSVLRNASQEKRPPQDRSGGAARRPSSDLDRFLEEARRRRGEDSNPTVSETVQAVERRPQEKKPQQRRQQRPPNQQPRRPRQAPATVIPVVLAEIRSTAFVEPISPLTAPAAILATGIGSAAPPIPVVNRSGTSVAPALAKVIALLRSMEGLRSAVVLNEIFGAPRCRRAGGRHGRH